LAVEAHSAIILVLNPATALSTYVVAAFASICVWIAEVTPLTYANSAFETEPL
jgi:hypothetical protein